VSVNIDVACFYWHIIFHYMQVLFCAMTSVAALFCLTVFTNIAAASILMHTSLCMHLCDHLVQSYRTITAWLSILETR
jgi:hypothetical protein